MSNVVLTGVCVSYDSDVVVSEVNLTVESGEWLAFIGPNGAGKTTILRAIARLVGFEGDIRIGGRVVTELRGRELARQVAMVLQEPQMPEGMTVSQYVLLGRVRTSPTSARRAAGTSG
jgi:iron complex transport system ATP-binding protein